MAYRIAFHFEGSLTDARMLNLIFVQIGPSEHSCVHNMWKTFASGNLKHLITKTMSASNFTCKRPSKVRGIVMQPPTSWPSE